MSDPYFDPGGLLATADPDAGLADRADDLSFGERAAICERVAACYVAMKTDQHGAPPPYRPGGEWKAFHDERRAFHLAMLGGDMVAVETALRDFWRNEHGAIVKEYATFAQVRDRESGRFERFQRGVRRNYLIWRTIVGADPGVLEIPAAGNPWGAVIEGRLVAPKATRFHALATQVADLVCDVGRPLVAEIGGGYGGMAYYLLRDRGGLTWIDIDLPETLVYAAYYLCAGLPRKRIFLYGEGSVPVGERLQEYDAILLPNYALPVLADRSIDVFVSTFSLSEMGAQTLAVYLDEIARCTRRYFLHHNMDRRGVFNRGFERIPASAFPVDGARLKLIARNFDLFHGQTGDYREFLYQRRCDA